MVLEKTKKKVSKTLQLRENLPFRTVLPKLASIILNGYGKDAIQRIYLFGSYAYGKPNKKSDLDICVVLDNIEERLEIEIEINTRLFDNKIVRCDVLVYKEEEFYNSKNSEGIENTIIKKGKILYERKKGY